MIEFKQPEAEQFFRTLSIERFAISFDEKHLVFSTNINGKYNLWGMNLPNNFPYPMTFVDQNCHFLEYDKKDRFIIAGFDNDGDENSQIYALPPEGGELKPIRTKEGARHLLPILSEDGKRLYYTSTKDNPKYLKSYCCNLGNNEEKTILEGSEAASYLIKIGPEEKSYIYLKLFANTYTPAFLRKDGKDILLTPQTKEHYTVADAVYISENVIYLLTDFEEDFAYLARFIINEQKFEKVLSLDKESFNKIEYNEKGNLLYLSSSKGVRDYLYKYSLDQNKIKKIDLPEVKCIEDLEVADSGNVYILARSSVRPLNIYKFENKKEEWKKLTNFGVLGVQEDDLIKPEIITYKSYDGLNIEALFFKAKKEKDNGHVIFWSHGGPQNAERLIFRSLFQFLLNSGYSIFAPNFRGSTNYGLKFMKMVEGDWGEGPRLDNIKGLDWLIENNYADKGEIFLMGGSFGGYMSLLLHGRHPEYFKAVIDVFGPSDLFSFIESVPEHWKPRMKQWVGDPVEDKERLTKDSPVTYLDSMVKPMLVVQGANDPRVVKEESDQIFKALRKKGTDVEYIVLDDEGHGFSKMENEIKIYRKVLEFLNRYVN